MISTFKGLYERYNILLLDQKTFENQLLQI